MPPACADLPMNAPRPLTPDQRHLAQTHQVTNVAHELVDYNLYTSDLALRAAVAREGAAWADAGLAAFGQKIGTAEHLEQDGQCQQRQQRDRAARRSDRGSRRRARSAAAGPGTGARAVSRSVRRSTTTYA